ncbi:MAG: hypothetical protein H6741_19840 [Alphaproteobacteria bacterium]|nr:hypothetical protein [Alphaproteobacteria bacterium]MCB9794958.1 hypothetical protein [Alphaproteobacteria bacterium]
MAELHQIIGALKAVGGARAALITTYNIWFPFFEGVVLPRLRGAGCRHIVLLMDPGQLAKALASPHEAPRRAGEDYLLAPVQGFQAFHPKLLLAVGPRSGRLWVGSHNMTLAGLNGNREVTNSAVLSEDSGARDLARAAWAAAQAWIPDTPLLREAAERFTRLAPWLEAPVQAPGEGPQLLASGAGPLWPQLLPLLPAELRRITVLGPFFDQRLRLLRALAALSPELIVGLQPTRASFPGDQAATLPPHVRLVRADALARHPKREAESYLHGKALLLEGARERLLVCGSANPSAPAWLDPAPAGNAEAMVAWRLPLDADPLGLCALAEAPPLAPEELAALEVPPFEDPAAGAPPSALAWVDGAELLLPLACPADEARLLGAYGAPLAEARPRVSEGETRIPLPAGLPERVALVELREGGALLLRAVVHHPTRLRRLARTGEEQRLSEALESLETAHPDIVGLLSFIEPLLQGPIQARPSRPGARRPPGERSPQDIGAGGVDLGEDELPDIEGYGSEGDLAMIMAWLHKKLGAPESVDRSEEELRGSQDAALLGREVFVPDLELRDLVRWRFDRIARGTAALLDRVAPAGRSVFAPKEDAPAEGSPSHGAMFKLSATLRLARALRHQHDVPRPAVDDFDFMSADALRGLVVSAVLACWHPLRRLLQRAADKVGPEAQELTQLPALLLWALHDLGERPPERPVDDPMRYTRDVDEEALLRRYIWLTLLPRAQAEPRAWAEAVEEILKTRSPARRQDGEAWLEAVAAWTRRLRDVQAEPSAYRSSAPRPRSGDLCRLPNGALAVVYKDVAFSRRGSLQVVAPGPAGGVRGQECRGATLLTPEAWPEA